MGLLNPEIILSIPLLVAVVVVLLIGVVGALVGWLLAWRRIEATSGFDLVDTPWLPDLLAALPHAAMLTDAQARVQLANDQARRWLWKYGSPAEPPQAVRDLIRRVAASGITEGIEVPAPGGTDHRLWIEATQLGSNKGILVLARDEAGASTTDQVYGRLLMHTVAHELRTPLTAILGHSEILESCSIQEEDLWRRSQEFIAREAGRLARLVEDLLILSWLGRQAPLLAPVSLRAVVEQAISAVWQSAEEKGVTVALRAAEGLPRVRADADRLQRAFTNLLENGVKYTPAQGQVTVELNPGLGCVQVEVSDTGIGISQDELPRIFDPFFRGEQAEETASGTGLGLVIAHTILAQHGAEVDVHSTPGEGTAFSFALPAAG